MKAFFALEDTFYIGQVEIFKKQVKTNSLRLKIAVFTWKQVCKIDKSCQPPVHARRFDLGSFQVPAKVNRSVKQMKVMNAYVKILCGN